MGTWINCGRHRRWRSAVSVLALLMLVTSSSQIRGLDGEPTGDAGVALQDGMVSPEDLPLDAEGRSAEDGRAIPGVVRANRASSELLAEQQALDVLRREIAEGQVGDEDAVRTQFLDENLPARFDSGTEDPDWQRAADLLLPPSR